MSTYDKFHSIKVDSPEWELLSDMGKLLWWMDLMDLPVGTTTYYTAIVENRWAFPHFTDDQIDKFTETLRKRKEWRERTTPIPNNLSKRPLTKDESYEVRKGNKSEDNGDNSTTG